jgi:hypothetical protein
MLFLFNLLFHFCIFTALVSGVRFPAALVVELDFLGALAHGGEVLVVRRIGRARDADGFNLLRDLHNDMGLLVI